jgi:glycosyltransferase involved in cell wall biosynthesis
MKIAQLNTHTYGGAAIVAKRVHLALLDSSVNSVLITKFGVVNDLPSHRYFKDGRIRNFLLKTISNPKLSPLVTWALNLNQHVNLAKRPKGFEIFSTWCSTVIPEMDDMLEECDIIHLHWTNDFFDYKHLFRKFSHKKFVWTLHDMNPITGGCHHSDGCMKFENICTQCPQLENTVDENYSKFIQDSKIEALSLLKNDQLIVASPSVWLSGLSQKSKITQRFKHVIVKNPSFNATIPNEGISVVRKKLGLPTDKKIVVFASGNLNNTRKGIRLLFEAIRSMHNKSEIVLLGIGHKAKPQKGLEIIYTGSLSNADLMASYYHVADVFVTPTLAENSPLVIIEALCCGTPVVASNVGGIPDLINDTNGILFTTGDISQLTSALHQALFEKHFQRDTIRNEAALLHNPTTIAEDYIRLYHLLSD